MKNDATSSVDKSITIKRRQPGPSAVLRLVGARIREARKARGFSQDRLAYAIPLDRAHIGMIENGKRAATIPTLVKLAIALDCELGEFFPSIHELRHADQHLNADVTKNRSPKRFEE